MSHCEVLLNNKLVYTPRCLVVVNNLWRESGNLNDVHAVLIKKGNEIWMGTEAHHKAAQLFTAFISYLLVGALYSEMFIPILRCNASMH